MNNGITPNQLVEAEIGNWEQELSLSETRLTKALLTTVIFVAKAILPQQAILLPQAARVFLETFQSSSSFGITSTLKLEKV